MGGSDGKSEMGLFPMPKLTKVLGNGANDVIRLYEQSKERRKGGNSFIVVKRLTDSPAHYQHVN